MLFEQLGTFRHADGSIGREREESIRAEQSSKDMMHGLKSIEDVALRAPERGEAQTRETRLQLADIAPAERQVVSEISGAGAIRFVKSERALQERRLELDHVVAERGEFA